MHAVSSCHRVIRVLPLLLLAQTGIAASDFVRELKVLQEQRAAALNAATEPINRRHQESLEQLLRRATQSNDLNAAIKIREALAAVPRAAPNTFQVVGKWRFRTKDWSGERTFFEDGSLSYEGGTNRGKWFLSGEKLTVDYLNGQVEEFTWPPRNGQISGKNNRGQTITARKP